MVNNCSRVGYPLIWISALVVISCFTLLTGCTSAPVYLVPETKNLPKSDVALLYRDGNAPGMLYSVDNKAIPDNSWGPSPVYLKAGEHDVTYQKWDYYGFETRTVCNSDTGCKHTAETIRTYKLNKDLGICRIRVVGGKTYTLNDVSKLLSSNGCVVRAGYPGVADK